MPLAEAHWSMDVDEVSPGDDITCATWTEEFRAHQGVKRASSGYRLKCRESRCSGHV